MSENTAAQSTNLRHRWFGFIQYADLKVALLYIIFIAFSIYTVTTASGSEMYEFFFRSGGGGGGLISPIVKHYIIVCFCALIVMAMVAMPLKHADRIRSVLAPLFFFASVGLLILQMCVGATINEAARWVHIGGISIQPSEIFKLGVVLALSLLSCLYQERKDMVRYPMRRYYYIPLLVIGGFVGYILYNNVSTGLIYAVAISLLLFIYEMPLKRYIPIFGGGAMLAMLAFLWLATTDTVPQWGRLATAKSRIDKMLAPKEEGNFEIHDENLQERFSQIAIANANIRGRGLGKSQMKEVLPMAMSDYVYAVVIEETGIIGVVAIPSLYIAWFCLVLMLARREKDKFFRYVLYGIGVFYPLQALVNIIVVSGLITTGQPLPFLSAGGSSALSGSLAFGFMLMISRWQTERQLESNQTKEEELEPSTDSPAIG